MNSSVHTFDKNKLSEYLEDHIPEFQGPIQSTKFKTGQSNPTFLIEDIRSMDWKPKDTWSEKSNIYFFDLYVFLYLSLQI